MDRYDNQPQSPAAARPATRATADSTDTPVPVSPVLSTPSSIYSPRYIMEAPIRTPSARSSREYPSTNDPQLLNGHFHPGSIPRTWSAPRDPHNELLSIFSSLEGYKGESSDNNGLDAAQSAIGHTIMAYKKSLLDELEGEGTIFGLKVQLPPDTEDYAAVRETIEYEALDYFDRLQAAIAAHEFREHGVPRERRIAFFGPPPPRETRDTRLHANSAYLVTLSLGSNDPRDIINSMRR
ncbi:hypothetical protein F4814DRAFT_404996 [Daldinia grandis]|nr:hypothetical protein F4814DRAFT_404996 [Daldinia grandis]